MKKITSLSMLKSRRQMLLAGIAALTLSAIGKLYAKETPANRSASHHPTRAKSQSHPAKNNAPKQTSVKNTAASKTKKETVRHPPVKHFIMIDPGHGGIDPGAVGTKGTEEKHIVLAVAKELRGLLLKRGYETLLTRDDDTFIPLYQRVEIAHQHGAELFMSIHADGFTQPTAAGASVFALSNRGASSAMAKYLAQRENAADDVAGSKVKAQDEHYLQQVLFDLVQTNTIKNSLTLGANILRNIAPIHKLHSKHTEQAAFVVLKSPSIPSVLVETSFITNPHEEKLLTTASFRHKMATAISEGVVNYFTWLDHQKARSRKK